MSWRCIGNRLILGALLIEAMVGLALPLAIIGVTIDDYEIYLSEGQSEVALWFLSVQVILIFIFFTVFPVILSRMVWKKSTYYRRWVLVWSILASIFMVGIPFVVNTVLIFLSSRGETGRQGDCNGQANKC